MLADLLQMFKFCDIIINKEKMEELFQTILVLAQGNNILTGIFIAA